VIRGFVFAAATAVLPVADSAAEPGADGDVQAGRGRLVYGSHCAVCHGPALEGGSAAALASAGFRERWRGLTVDDLVHVIGTQMPWGNPGILSSAEVLDVTGHLLRANGFAPGMASLPADAAERKRMVLDW
jgi:mono/diheme cytochrome c family protein